MKTKVQEESKEELTMKDIAHQEEWATTRALYSQLCLLGTMQLLLMNRLIPRFKMHRLEMAREQKMLIGRALPKLMEAQKLFEMMDMQASGLGKGGMDDFFRMNDILAREGYDALRILLMWQNATRHGLTDQEAIENAMNKLSTGHKRWFSKKLIDTFRLNA